MRRPIPSGTPRNPTSSAPLSSESSPHPSNVAIGQRTLKSGAANPASSARAGQRKLDLGTGGLLRTSGVMTRLAIEAAPFQRAVSTTASSRQATSLAKVPLPHSQYVPSTDPPPLNEAQVPLISPNLRRQLFPAPGSPYSPAPPSQQAIDISLAHLRTNGLLAAPSSSAPSKTPAPAVDFQLPALQGPTLSHHFHALGHASAEPYASIARSFASMPVPPMPSKWLKMSGWTHYNADGSCESVDYPSIASEAMVFDVETLPYQGGSYPIMAVAVGKDGWYGWCSPWLIGDDASPNHLIPFSPPAAPATAAPAPDTPFSASSTLFEPSDAPPRLIVGHHVLFDRARVESEYSLRRPSTRYLDTLSLHVAVSGLTNPQRPAWLQYRKKQAQDEKEAAAAARKVALETATEDDPLLAGPPAAKKKKKSTNVTPKTWKEVASVNSLAEVARLHCGITMDKAPRDVLIDPDTTIADARAMFDELINYCASDVLTTIKVYQVLLPKFLKTCPHPASLAGVLLMSQPVLPVDYRWPQYVQRAETTYTERLKGVKDALHVLAEQARSMFEQVDENGKFVWEDDVWLRQLDWSPKTARRLPPDVLARQAAALEALGTTTSAEELAPLIEEEEVAEEEEEAFEAEGEDAVDIEGDALPLWFLPVAHSPISIQSPLAALLFRTTWRSFPVVFTHSHGWLFSVNARRTSFDPQSRETLVSRDDLGPRDDLARSLPNVKLYTVPSPSMGRCRTLLGRGSERRILDELIQSKYPEMARGAAIGKDGEAGTKYKAIAKKLAELAEEAVMLDPTERKKSLWLRQLDWTPDPRVGAKPKVVKPATKKKKTKAAKRHSTASLIDVDKKDLIWPSWYKDLDLPGLGLDVSVRKRAVPLLLKLRWNGFPVVFSKQYGWVYRVPNDQLDKLLKDDPSLKPLKFTDVTDSSLEEDTVAIYFKLPHPEGEDRNVGSPLSKPFVQAFEDKILTSEYPIAEAALSLNASCSYWTSARERISNQMVVWDGKPKTPTPTPADPATQGLILPQVIPMGTVTRRAVEKTWLTASNAKKNRVGSELKSMVRAPEGYAIVGADVDSEELWICSVMGDAQFGIHGATAIGWMTLEGTKAAGTDLHSKSASILGISRDDAKVFNYSRIYGAGVKHALQLLLKSNPLLSTEQATSLVKALYASTKGVVDRTNAFARHFWHGGTESFVFNKLEGIAQSDRPRTPALGCGLTDALTKAFLPAQGRSRAGEDFMPSRINWVVQSSGVDYLHLLLVAMEYLTKRFEIDARYMISVHDEIRYLVKEEDKYRAAMALQVANLWTRSLFSYRLQMADLPQGCAFFSAVDIDHCFRKEVNMTCLTPSNPDSIPFGESLDVNDSLARTSHGSLFPDGRPMSLETNLPTLQLPSELSDDEVRGDPHRVPQSPFLLAQTSSSPVEIQKIWRSLTSKLPSRPYIPPSAWRTRVPVPSSSRAPPVKKLGAAATPAVNVLQAGNEVDWAASGTSETDASWEDEMVPDEVFEDDDFSPYKPLGRSDV